jgi:hypothetical protein
MILNVFAHLTPRDTHEAMLRALSADPENCTQVPSPFFAGRFYLVIAAGRD